VDQPANPSTFHRLLCPVGFGRLQRFLRQSDQRAGVLLLISLCRLSEILLAVGWTLSLGAHPSGFRCSENQIAVFEVGQRFPVVYFAAEPRAVLLRKKCTGTARKHPPGRIRSGFAVLIRGPVRIRTVRGPR